MSLGIDLLLIVVIALCAVSGVKRGFIRTIMNFVTVIAAGLGAWYFTPSFSLYLRSAYLEERITDPVTQTIKSLMSPSLNGKDAMPQLFLDMPDAFASLLQRYGASSEAAQNSVTSGSTDAATTLANFLAEPAVKMISDALAFILLFIGIALALTIITVVLDLIFKLPILSGLNRLGGLLLGLACGALYAWVIVFVITSALPYLTQVLPKLFNSSTLTDTFIANWLSQYNPISIFNIPLFRG
jgi:Colicin V production protein.